MRYNRRTIAQAAAHYKIIRLNTLEQAKAFEANLPKEFIFAHKNTDGSLEAFFHARDRKHISKENLAWFFSKVNGYDLTSLKDKKLFNCISMNFPFYNVILMPKTIDEEIDYSIYL